MCKDIERKIPYINTLVFDIIVTKNVVVIDEIMI